MEIYDEMIGALLLQYPDCAIVHHKPTRKTFCELCDAGKVGEEKIDDFIDEWHKSNTTLRLHEYLGINKARYRTLFTH